MPILSTRKLRVGKEKALLNAWLLENHATDTQWRNVRLGPIPVAEMARAFSVIRRYADAIFLKDGVVHIVEAKVRPNPGVVGQLEHYAMLFPDTPEFQQFQNWPIKMILLSSVPDLMLLDLVAKKNIDMVIMTPTEVNETRNKFGQQVVEF